MSTGPLPEMPGRIERLAALEETQLEVAELIERSEQLNRFLDEQKAKGYRIAWVGEHETVVDKARLAKLEEDAAVLHGLEEGS